MVSMTRFTGVGGMQESRAIRKIPTLVFMACIPCHLPDPAFSIGLLANVDCELLRKMLI